MEKQPIYQFGNFELDSVQKILLHDGQRVPLDHKTFLILLALVETDGHVISKNELMAKVWPDSFVEENNLTKNISRLRKALGNGDESAGFIETIPKVGYRFITEISFANAGNGSANGTIATEAVGTREAEQKRADKGSRQRSTRKSVRKRWFGAGLACALTTGAALTLWNWSPSHPTALAVASEFAPVRLTNHVAADSHPEYSPDGKKIVFSSNRDGQQAIYLMKPDGSDVRKLTNNLKDSAPHWTSDGKSIYFWGGDATYEVSTDGSGPVKLPSPYGLLSPNGQKVLMVKSLVEFSRASAEIFIANADGSKAVRLTNNHSLDTDASWSPDGKYIAFTCFPDGFVEGGNNNPEICVMNADGSNMTRLTNDPAWDNWPVWSRDGTQILFGSFRGCNGWEALYVMNSDGSNVIRLTDCTDNARYGNWSPDNKWIVYASEHDGNSEIYSIIADPSHQTNITKNLAEDSAPVWSPDSSKIAFISNRSGKDSLFVMDADGANPQNFINNVSGRLSWSPNGRQIAFAATWAGSLDVCAVNANGNGIVQLTHSPAHESEPVWSPDGTKILFNYNDGKMIQLYVMNADGSGITRISNSPEHEWQHDWSPDGQQIIFTRSRNRSVQRDIWMMNADGSQPRLIAKAPGLDEFVNPRFSTDGRHIAFQCLDVATRQWDIWRMNASGSGQTRLTHLGGVSPTWSPDGKRIVFYSSKRAGNSEIYVMDVASR